jgi:hypothetical protein
MKGMAMSMNTTFFGRCTHTCPKCGAGFKFLVVPDEPKCDNCKVVLERDPADTVQPVQRGRADPLLPIVSGGTIRMDFLGT